MIEKILSWLLTKWLNRESLKTFGSARSPYWGETRNEFIKKNPFCAVCGKKTNLAVHHKKPFHLFPELELKESNLVTLCESAGMHCHITFGHLGNFKSYNQSVEQDIKIWNVKVMNKP